MTQANLIVIDIGAEANDGTGDPLRSAFNDVNLNFANVFAAGPVNSNVSIANNTIQTNNSNGNLILKPNGTGNVIVNASVEPDIGGIRNLGSPAKPFSDVYATTLDVGQVTIDEVVASNVSIANTLQANVINSNAITVLSNANINLSGNLLANRLVQSDTLAVASLATIGNLAMTGSANLGGNVSMQGNLTVPQNLTSNTLTVLSTTFFSGNIVGDSNLILGNGDVACDNILASGNLNLNGDTLQFGNANIGGFISAGGNIGTPGAIFADLIQANTIIANIVGNVTGNLVVGGTINAGQIQANSVSANGNVSGNLLIGNIRFATGGYANTDAVAYGELGWTGNFVPISGGSFSLGNASNPWRSLYVSNNTIYIANVPLNMYPDNVLHVNGQPVLQNFSNTSIQTTGNLTASYFIGNGALLSNITSSNIVGQVANALVAGTVYEPAQPTITSVGNLSGLTVVGNTNSGNIDTAGQIVAQGNITSNARIQAQSGSITGNLTANIITAFNGLEVTGTTTTHNIIPAANISYSLGNSTNWFSNIWVAGNTLFLGGVGLGMAAGNTLTVAGEAVLTNNSNISIDTTGNLSAGNIIATGDLTGGNLEINAAQIRLATGATENTLSLRPDGGVGSAGVDIPDNDTANTVDLTLENSAGNVKIKSAGLDGWLFGADNSLTAPGDISANGNIAVNNVVANSNISADDLNANSATFTGNISAGNLTIAETVFANFVLGNDTVVLGNGDANIQVFVQESGVGIQTLNGNVYNTWFYDNAGNLNLPGGYTVGEPGVNFLKIFAPGNTLGVQIDYDTGVRVDMGNAGAGNAVSLTVDSNTWSFDFSGNLNLPGNTSYIKSSANTVEMYSDDAETNGFLFYEGGAQVYASGNFEIFSDWASTGNIWTFYANGQLNTPGAIVTAGDANVGGNLTAHGVTTTTSAGITANGANININEITGTGGYLNATGANLSGNLSANNVATVDLSITGNIVGDINTGNNATIGGNLSVLGTAGITAGSLLIDTTSGITANSGNIAINQITGQGGYLIATGVELSNSLVANGNITGANIDTAGLVSATGNISGGNINTAGDITANANITATGNIAGGNIISTGNVEAVGINATGNIAGGNLNCTGLIAVTGNISANNFVASNSLVGASLNISGDATVAGNLSVQGNLIYIDIDDLRIQDPVIQLGGGANGNALVSNDGKDRGTLLNYYVTNPGNAFMGWKNTSGNMFIASNVSIANDVITVNDYGTTEIGQLYAQSGVFVGNLSANYLSGNGSQLTGMYGNAEVAAYLPTYTGNLSGLTGNVTTTANIQANYFIGNGSQLTGMYGNAEVAAYLPSYTGNLTSLTGNISTTANINANYFLGNGSQLTGMYGNTEVGAYLPTYTGNFASLTGDVTTTGNVSGNFIIGDGSLLTNLPTLDNYSNANVANYLPIYSGNLANLGGNVVTTANIQANYFLGNGSQLTGMYGNAEVATYLPTYTGNLTALTGNITTTANVQANYFLGNGSQLTGIVSSYGDANVANYLPTYTGNITSLTGNVVTTANISANYFLGNGSQLTGIPDSNAITNGTSTVAIASANGNIFVDVANVGVAQFTQLGVDVLNLNSLGNVTANGNIDAGNVLLSGNATAVVVVTDPKNFSDLTPINGGRAFILDANLVAAGNFGANVSGGGSNTAPVWSDGANWYIG